MITTLTPNPSFDHTLSVDRLNPGRFHRAAESTIEAGGKGINVSRALAAAGVKSRCLFPAPAATADRLTSLVKVADNIDVTVIKSSSPVRHNVTVIDANGETTKVNERGETPSSDDLNRLVEAAERLATGCKWFVMSGSLPFGVEPQFYQRIQEVVTASGARFVVDSSGPALVSAVLAGCEIIKPNTNELAELVGRELHTLGDVVKAAKWAHTAGVSQVLVSMGANGALLVNSELTAHASAPPTTVRNTVGAGDAALAGFLYGGGQGKDALAAAVAWGSAAAASPGTAGQAPRLEARRSITVTAVDHDRILEES